MDPILLIIVAMVLAAGLAGVRRVLLRLEWRQEHPTLETRQQMLESQFASTDMTTEEYEQELSKLQKEDNDVRP